MTRLRRAIPILALLVLLPDVAAAAQTYPLIGVTGDSNTNPPPPLPPESLFLLNQTNASALFVMSLGNGADGESIGFNPDNGLLYHGSGMAVGDRYWESVDVLGKTIVSSGQFTGDVSASHESLSMTYNPATQRFLVADLNDQLLDATLAGVATNIGGLPAAFKGLAFAGGTLYAAPQGESTLYEIDPSDASVISTIPVTLGGNAVTGMNGLATHPQTGVLWGIFRVGFNPGVRHLGTIDPTTGVVTSVGTLPSSFAGIAFLPEPSSSAAVAAGAIAVALCALGRRSGRRSS
jgi:hypothetical protein